MASIWTALAKALRVDAPTHLPAIEEGQPPLPVRPPANDADTFSWEGVPGPAQFGRFQPIIDALRAEMVKLARNELAAHRAINPNFHCQVTSIEIVPRSVAAEAPLKSLLTMHRPERLAALLRDVMGKMPYGSFFEFSGFGGLVPLPPPKPAAHDEVQAMLEEIHGDPKSSSAYKVVIRWSPADHPRPSAFAQDSRMTAESGDAVLWQLTDGAGRRDIAMVRREARDPLVLGTSESADVVVGGKYTSSRHGAVWFDKGCWWYRDTGSTNGSRVLRPDQEAVVFPAAGSKAAPPAAVELTPGCRIVFTATEEGDPADYPQLERPRGDRARATPQAPRMRAPGTALASIDAAAPEMEAVARLQVSDVLGQREIAIAADQLPFSIGRDQAQSCPVPWDHKTVSGKHLQLLAIEEGGARMRMIGHNGGTLEGRRVDGGAEMLWPWGGTAALGAPTPGEPEYRLTLLKG